LDSSWSSDEWSLNLEVIQIQTINQTIFKYNFRSYQLIRALALQPKSAGAPSSLTHEPLFLLHPFCAGPDGPSITAQLGPPTYPFIFPHRQVGPDRQPLCSPSSSLPLSVRLSRRARTRRDATGSPAWSALARTPSSAHA
jgi:hypothetical protein